MLVCSGIGGVGVTSKLQHRTCAMYFVTLCGFTAWEEDRFAAFGSTCTILWALNAISKKTDSCDGIYRIDVF